MSGKHIVFDFGVVLFRWRPNLLLQQCLPQRVSDEASAAHWVAQVFQSYGGDWGDFDRGTVTPATLVQRISARTGLTPAEVQAVVDAVPGELQPIAAAESLVHRLADADPDLFYLSNMPAPYADHLERTHAVLKRFADGVFSARVGLVKPDPAIFALSAQRFGKAPGDLVFLDDHPANVAAARQAGWNALHFENAAQAEAQLHEKGWWPAG
ncbi:haloacid dehalogenase superfamily protein, subfamily IA, variant 3 with third motif having DD or ED [Burkholderiales bacterium JOSHI_001]|nr:haloacid dehalogenase superfamily protein, subfamily IA, variant 3 with third motif having DD or ED [Burkholderiales bacterium JOSHI_001]